MKKLFLTVLIAIWSISLFGVDENNYEAEMELAITHYNDNYIPIDFESFDGTNIAATAKIDETGTNAVIILPGRTEAFIKYAELAYDLKDLDADIYMMDHRGQGYSDRLIDDGHKGYVERFDHYVEDLNIFISEIVNPVNAPKYDNIFIVAHSMGGAIAARYLEKNPDHPITAAVLSSPMLQINTGKYPEWLAYSIVSLATAFGKGKEYAQGHGPRPDQLDLSEFDTNGTTHSYVRWYNWEKTILAPSGTIDKTLAIGGATNNWVKRNIEATWAIKRHADKVTIPVLMFKGGEDHHVVLSGLDKFCNKALDCESVFFENARHEILMEADEINGVDVRRAAINHIIDFISSF